MRPDSHQQTFRSHRHPFAGGIPSMVVGAVLLAGFVTKAAGAEVLYNQHIRPILAEHCLHCHGPDADQRQADLRLDRASAANDAVIRPGQPDQSEFLRRITSVDPDDRMPPPDTGKKLTPEQIERLKTWVTQGAPYKTHWAFRPITPPEVPLADEESLTEIDRFLVAKQRSLGLHFAPPVNRQQWLRRVTFDLTGLPPTWSEVEAFVYDSSPEAYEKVVDRLLNSPRYGERWGRHWLDLARYADTQGGAAIGFQRFPFSYTYRDYVIQAWNEDRPYDEFILEQLAADQLDRSSTHPSLAALGFLTVGQQFRNPNDTIDDQIDVVTRGLMGLTVTCARCHDHKYDPIPTKDYYALYATLAPNTTPDELPTVNPPEESTKYQKYATELANRKRNYSDMARDQTAVMRGRLRMQVGLYLRELAKGTPEQDLTAVFLSYRTDDLRPHILEGWRTYLAELPEQDPVFGPWLTLSQESNGAFAERCQTLTAKLRSENGTPKSPPAYEKLSVGAPRWNPRVLDAIDDAKPKSLLELADAYGGLFATVHQEWLQALVAAATEALPDRKPVPDENRSHRTINSAVDRQLRHHLFAPESPLAMPDREGVRYLNRPIRDNVSGRKGAIRNLNLNDPGSPPRAMVLTEDTEDRPFHVFRRGNPLDRGDTVQARFLSTVSNQPLNAFQPGERRLGLAQAIVHPENPLTRRVLVNWVWQHHFGQGIVRTPDDFGTRGDPPTHPELLDHLASQFEQDGWSLKQLHKRLVLTQAYRQGAVETSAFRDRDPDNQFLWRMPRRRLDLEAMRDALLAASGELDLAMGGRPFDWDKEPIQPRRSVYAFVNRDVISPLASTFDGPNPSSCTAQRSETTVPQQTLFALNSQFIQDRAAALAKRISEQEPDNTEQRLRLLFQRVYSRQPQPHETTLAHQFLEQETEAGRPEAWTRLAHALLAANEFVFVD